MLIFTTFIGCMEINIPFNISSITFHYNIYYYVDLIKYGFLDIETQLTKIFPSVLLISAPFSIFFGIKGSRSWINDIQMLESFRLSGRNMLKNILIGMIIGGVIGIILIILFSFIWFKPFNYETYPIIMIFAIICSIPGAMIGALFGGIDISTIDTKNYPNLGIWVSLKNSISIMIYAEISLLLIKLLMFFKIIVILKISVDIHDVIFLWDGIGLLFFLWYGGLDFIRHFILRLLLWRDNKIPWNYVEFLDHCVDRILLQKVGGGYIFIHRMLMEYFAELETIVKK